MAGPPKRDDSTSILRSFTGTISSTNIMREATHYDAVTRDGGSDKDNPNSQQHETITTPSDQSHYDAVDEKPVERSAIERSLTAESHVHQKVRRPDIEGARY